MPLRGSQIAQEWPSWIFGTLCHLDGQMALSGALRRLIDFGSGWALEGQQAVLRDMCMGQVEKFTAVNFGSI
jgi:hypothetical protein